MSKDKSNDQVLEEKTLEEAFTELDGLAEKLEDRETSLEDSFRFYRQGMELLKFCSDMLHKEDTCLILYTMEKSDENLI